MNNLIRGNVGLGYKSFYLLALPLILPVVDVGTGTAIIFGLTLAIFGLTVFLQRNAAVDVLPLALFIISISCLCFSLIIQNGFVSNYDAEFNNYLFRLSMLYFLFLVFSCYLKKKYSNRYDAFSDFTRLLFLLVVASLVFEYFLRLFDFKSILYLYKARQDLGGIDSVHYNRFSGFTSFPGDMAALIALAFVCIQTFSYSKTKLFILFFAILLTQSKAGIVLLFLYYSAFGVARFSFKSISFVILGVVFFIGAVQLFELEYYLKFLDNLEHYAVRSKRAQEMFLFFEGSSMEIMFGNYSLKGMYFESELFSTLNRNGVLGSIWFFCVLSSLLVIYFKKRVIYEKDLVLFLIVFTVFYCFLSAGFSRSKIGVFYVFVISIFTIPSIQDGKSNIHKQVQNAD